MWVCIISLCNADRICVHFFHPTWKRNSFWVQHKSVLILQITALHSMSTNANQTSTVWFHQVFINRLNTVFFTLNVIYFHECVPITVAHKASSWFLVWCLWSFVFQWKQNTYCRTVSYVSYIYLLVVFWPAILGCTLCESQFAFQVVIKIVLSCICCT